jgi:hypothetical protein
LPMNRSENPKFIPESHTGFISVHNDARRARTITFDRRLVKTAARQLRFDGGLLREERVVS